MPFICLVHIICSVCPPPFPLPFTLSFPVTMYVFPPFPPPFHVSRYRAMYDLIEMPWDWPVEVNYHEAKAFCHWKGEEYRLPTEAEYTRMRCDPVSPCADASHAGTVNVSVRCIRFVAACVQ